MRIDHLKYLIVVTEAGSISHAAEQLYISQQGLSQAIRQLEKQLGVTLLNRTGNKIYLSETGMKIAEKAKELLVKYDEIMKIAKISSENLDDATHSHKITLLTTPFLAGTLLPDLVCKFSQKHPNINLMIDEKIPPEILKIIKEDQEAIGLFSIMSDKLNLKEFSDSQINFEPFYKCQQFACVTKSSPLAQQKSITLSELAQYPLAILDIGQNAKQILTSLEPFGKFNIMLRTGNNKLYRETIASGLAVGFTNTFAEFFEKKDSVITIPIENTPPFILGWAYSTNSSRTEFQNEFIHDLIRYVKRLKTNA
ncbi:LysR family transcriptional regulator [Desulfitobacterium sp. Sab5]|uniref:LysR family transcriptional regulator n=1 Tax=Desulfitobacterium nosdiversum TaxID=3375356 RepID=UPI003CF826ED